MDTIIKIVVLLGNKILQRMPTLRPASMDIDQCVIKEAGRSVGIQFRISLQI